jgi:hypothetical protein
MANPTSNFNWQMPTASDLVTDLPADFEVFGQAVDTSLADLKGGTTDQVLAKNSNTDMDFKWVTSDDANAIQNSIVDAKGDLIAASANDTPARLAVGNNGETLVADSSATTGLRYQPSQAAGKNGIINGGMDIWQRGTSIACSATAYTADRWQGYRGVAGATVSRQTSSLTLDSIQYCARVQRDSGNTSTSTIWFSQAIETVNSYPFAGKAITFSFYARAGANYSAASSNLNVRLRWGTGTDQNPLGSWTGGGFTVSTTATLTTSWQRFTFTGTVDATATELAAYVGYDGVGTAGAADYFEMTGVQLEVGSVATAFSRAGGTIQGELAACQRYFQRIANGADNLNENLGAAQALGTTSVLGGLNYLAPMRVTPTMTISSAGNFGVLGAGGNVLTATALTFSQGTPRHTRYDVTVASGLVAGNASIFLANSASATLDASAEL